MGSFSTISTDYKKLREEFGDLDKDVIPEEISIWGEQTWTSSTSVTSVVKYDLNRHYVARITDYTPPGTYPSTVTKPSTVDVNAYWTQDGVTIPSGYYNYLAIYSRASLLYPFVGAYTKLPDLTPFPSDTGVWFCSFEHGGATKTGMASFFLYRASTGIILYAVYGSGSWLYMDITSRLPSDYTTAMHLYYVKVNKWGAEFFIDNRLVAVALDIPGAIQGVKATCPPYAIGVTDAPVIKRLHALVEIGFPYPTSTNITPNPGSLTLPLNPLYFRWGEDVPNPPRALRLYQANSTSLMAGASISSGSLSSHPIPIYGRTSKTFYFMADQAGTLLIEIYTLSGNWRTYDSVSVSANTLLPYVMTGDAVLARVTYTPSTYTATISEAEVVLV
jgi:hypothetical protein